MTDTEMIARIIDPVSFGGGVNYSPGRARAALAKAEQILAALSRPVPIDMLLFCPKCGIQHVDEPEHVLVWTGGGAPEPSHDEVIWDNPPHRSHLCHACGCIWRPADAATNGVAAIQTVGKADTWGESNCAALATPSPSAEYRRGLEDAAKVAEDAAPYIPPMGADDDTAGYSLACREIATAIRALATKGQDDA